MSASEPRKGYAFELRCLKHLLGCGYWAIRTPASKGALDIIAIRRDRTLMVQCKVDGNALYPLKWNALKDLAEAFGCVPVLACRNGRKLEWWRLTGWKEVGVTTNRQPREPFDPAARILKEAGY